MKTTQFTKKALLKEVEGVPFFEKLSSNDIEKLCSLPKAFIQYDPKEIIIEEGGPGDALFVLIQGDAIVMKGRRKSKMQIAKLSSGSLFGEMAFFTKKSRTSSVLAESKVVVLKVDAEFFEQMEPRVYAEITQEIIETLVKRLDKMNNLLVSMAKMSNWRADVQDQFMAYVAS